jgi:hypothetical protein
VSDPYLANDILMSLMETMVGDNTDMEAAQMAFEATPGDFTARFTAAVRASLVGQAKPEVFIDLPPDPAALRRNDLDALVRPVADGFLRSYPSKEELLDQVRRIARRQERRPAWIPRVDRDGVPLATPRTDDADGWREPDRPVVISALSELGDITVLLPEAGEDRADLAMAAGGIGEWESVLCTVLGLTGPRSPASAIPLDERANMALVPAEARWRPAEPADPKPACEEPGVASELLATSATLGGLEVAEDSLDTAEAVADALVGAGDWRYSPRWLLESWGPGDDVPTLTVARAAVAGWAHDARSGLIAYVYGGCMDAEAGQIGSPEPLHSYLLVVTRAQEGTDLVAAVHRMVLSCPGESWCHRGGCPEVDFLEAASLLAGIVTAGEAFNAAFDSGGPAAQRYRAMYGDTDTAEYCDSDSVLELVLATLEGADWRELERSTWDGGMEEALLRRRNHCLTVLYDPVNRQIRIADGLGYLESTLQLLFDDGVLTEADDQVSVLDRDVAAERWGAELLAAAEDLLDGRIVEMEKDFRPVQATVLGLHPHADGTLRGPESSTLASRQIDNLLRAARAIPTA